MLRAAHARNPSSAARGSRRRLTTALAVALAGWTLATFWPATTHPFIAIDDGPYVVKNPVVRAGITVAGVLWAMTSFDAANWHPLTWLSHMLDVTLFGVNAHGHHFTSVLLHALNSALLFLALRRLTGAIWSSAIVAALFGLHPLHVESVAWVAERKDVLSAFFFMLVLLLYERHVRQRAPARYLLVGLALALGLAAKPMLVTTPFVLLLLDYWPLGRLRDPGGRRAAVLEKIPLLALAAASGIVAYLAQASGGAVPTTRLFTPGIRVGNALASYARYLAKTVWPAELSIFYPFPETGVESGTALAGMLLVAGVTLLALGPLRRRGYIATGWSWYLGMLVPVLGIVQVGGQAMADRYTYLPLIGVFLAAVWAVADLCRSSRPARACAGAVAVALFLTLTAAARHQLSYWRSNVVLFRQALATAPDYPLILSNYGVALIEEGQVQEGSRILARAGAANPVLRAELHHRTGLIRMREGQRAAAIAEFREALRIYPPYRPSQEALGALGIPP
ncbi:MAG TPA: glycosyltransferase family 39 protein [Candidatus Methanoperedens sp.]|nr:glycosyltransferase family 39 protein [Candidatus Methanoperedens sp.]